MHPRFHERELPPESIHLVERWTERSGCILLRQPASRGPSTLYFSPRWRIWMERDGRLSSDGCPVPFSGLDPLRLPYRLAQSWPRQRLHTPCGLSGYLNYDLGPRAAGCAHERPLSRTMPEMSIGLYDAAFLFGDGPPRLAVADLSPLHAAPRSLPELWEDRAAEFLGVGAVDRTEGRSSVELELPDVNWHHEAICRIQDYLRRGHVYQANLTAQIRARCGLRPWRLFEHESEGNPTDYAAFLRLPDGVITSFSPELLLQLRDGSLLSSPIKGTAAPHEREQLRQSEKDRAEHVMIVDLSRNDLGRVSAYGSVVVDELMREMQLRGLVHLVSDVRGRLQPGREAELLPSLFPGGSITGAPKRRAMEIISEVELSRRGIYTGSIGVLRADGSSIWNIAIRTALWQEGEVRFGCGGGIVLDSDPEREYSEALLKAESFVASLQTCARNEQLART